jgi:hypothetical protein
LDCFKLHHILRQDNEVADALSRFGSSREPPPLGVFTQDLIKPTLGALPREDGPIPMSEADPGPSAGLIKPSLGPEGE